MFPTKKILLGQLAARGDCLYATALARQIKYDYPGCHLTWAIGSMCKNILDNNPYVDRVWEIPVRDHSEVVPAWIKFEAEARALKKACVFDELFLTQLHPNNYQNFDGTVRTSIFRAYPHPITVPVAPVVRLTTHEVDRVKNFVQHHDLLKYKHVILFECSSHSGQSFVTHDFAIEVAKKIIDSMSDVCIILSSQKSIQSADRRIIDGSVVAFRENLELVSYCSLLVGCSSGISWLCTAQDAPSIPKIQLLRREQSVFASMIHDFEHFGLSTEFVMEMTECQPQRLYECITCCISEGFGQAKRKFHETIPLTFHGYFLSLSKMVAQRHIKKAMTSMRFVIKRYGLKGEFIKAFLAMLPRTIIRFLKGK